MFKSTNNIVPATEYGLLSISIIVKSGIDRSSARILAVYDRLSSRLVFRS